MATKKKNQVSKKKPATGSPRKNPSKKAGRNKPDAKNSLVSNINAKKKNGTSRSKKDSTISKKAYDDMENNWGEKSKK